MNQTANIAANLADVRQRMAAAARRAGRSVSEITLLAVSKTHPVELIEQALAAGQQNFGENRVEEAWAKFVAPDSPESLASRLKVADRPRLHLIGPIQSRKASLALACRPALIHAVDRLKIADRLDRLAGEAHIVQEVLLEVNVAGEASKFGFSPLELQRDAELILALPHLRVAGLMTIPPYQPDPEAARPHFVALRLLRDQLAQRYPQADWRHLSMGMSHDFETAIEESATIVRVGTAIFGTRNA
ncbi:MAG: YggS family pyridoxal phosphate-dependent enzyme [Anaerolineae bacterium]